MTTPAPPGRFPTVRVAALLLLAAAVGACGAVRVGGATDPRALCLVASDVAGQWSRRNVSDGSPSDRMTPGACSEVFDLAADTVLVLRTDADAAARVASVRAVGPHGGGLPATELPVRLGDSGSLFRTSVGGPSLPEAYLLFWRQGNVVGLMTFALYPGEADDHVGFVKATGARQAGRIAVPGGR